MCVPNPKILLIQREQASLELFKKRLSEWGYDADGTHDALEALDWLKNNRYELVISDDKLPMTDPLQLFQQMREYTYENFGVTVPIFGINGSGKIEQGEELREAGCGEIFSAPLTGAALRKMRYISYNHLYAHWWFTERQLRKK